MFGEIVRFLVGTPGDFDDPYSGRVAMRLESCDKRLVVKERDILKVQAPAHVSSKLHSQS